MTMDVRELQQALVDMGFDPGSVDGIMGPKTKTAIRYFQRMNGLHVDGIPGRRTQAKLAEKFPDRDSEPQPSGHPSPWPYSRDIRSFYGQTGKNQTRLVVPYRMRIAWDKRKTIKSFSCHEKVHDSLLRILTKIPDHYGESNLPRLGLDLFGGCLNVRKMRGGNSWSRHSWGIAIDLDPEHNQFRWKSDRAKFARPEYDKLHDFFSEEGWVNLGRAIGYDWMHWEAVRR